MAAKSLAHTDLSDFLGKDCFDEESDISMPNPSDSEESSTKTGMLLTNNDCCIAFDNADDIFKSELPDKLVSVKKPVFYVGYVPPQGETPVILPPDTTCIVPEEIRKAELQRRRLKTCPLRRFTQGGVQVKHEFFVIKITRRFVRSIETVVRNRPISRSGILTRTDSSPKARENLQKFESFVKEKKSCFEEFVKADYLPASDKANKRKGEAKYRSFSKEFMHYYLNLTPYLLIAYSMFCEVVFENECESLCAAWKMNCCSDGHYEDCKTNWADLKIYAQVHMLEELDISPYLQ